MRAVGWGAEHLSLAHVTMKTSGKVISLLHSCLLCGSPTTLQPWPATVLTQQGEEPTLLGAVPAIGGEGQGGRGLAFVAFLKWGRRCKLNADVANLGIFSTQTLLLLPGSSTLPPFTDYVTSNGKQ